MVTIHQLGLQHYIPVWQAMKHLTLNRNETTNDELWLLQHYPVYTQGQAGKAEHMIQHSSIPLVQSDRGGQITYHGPGQLVAYTLLDLKRRQLGIRTLVSQLEQTLIALLQHYGIDATTQCGAPGVYVEQKKIASIGLRVKNGCTYHGIALNVAMDLSPFDNINPCGYRLLQMTQLLDFVDNVTMPEVSRRFADEFLSRIDCPPALMQQGQTP